MQTATTSTDGGDEGHRLTDEDRVAIDKLRKEVKHLLPEDCDTEFNLYRWLKAWSFDHKVTVDKLCRHLRLRSAIDMPYVMSIDFKEVPYFIP